MRKKIKFIFYFIIIFIIVLVFFTFLDSNVNIPLNSEKIDAAKIDYISLPPNFKINVFADLEVSSRAYPGPNVGPRFMAFKDDILFVSVSKQGKVVALQDKNKDGKADKIITTIDKLNNPHGLAFYKDWLYIAEEDRIIRVKDINNNLIYETESMEVIVNNLPEGGHWTRTIKIFNDSLYISIGSSCNACNEANKFRASIIKCSIEGKNCKTFASGLRNAVGFTFHPLTNELIATENSRDLLGNDLPPEEINIVKEGKNYGWPTCYGNQIHDTNFDKNVYIRNPCLDTEKPLIEFQAHSAPLGLAVYDKDQFPAKYKGKLFVAYHGSWNRKVPTGYKVVTMNLQSKEIEDFATGWLTEDFKVLGRPVDIIVDKEGSLFVTDDNAGLVYKIIYKK